MPVRPRRVAALAALPTVIMTGMGVAFAAGPADAPEATSAAAPAYAGSAYALKAQLSLAGTTLLDQLLPDLVKYPPGGAKSLLDLPPELAETATLNVLNVSSNVKKDVLHSNARTAGLSVLTDLVTAAVLNADCTAEGLKLDGDSQVTDLAIAGIKVPVDPGPNFEVEIPDALKPFLSGGIWVDKQDKLADGTLRIRALQIRLVIDPLGLQKALESIVAEVKAAAQKVVSFVEETTGETLEQIVAKERAARGLLPVPAVTDHGGTARNGASGSREDVRGEYAARKAAKEQTAKEQTAKEQTAKEQTAKERAERAGREAALREQQARSAEAAAVAAQQRAAEAQAAADSADAADAAAAPEQAPARTVKGDPADVAHGPAGSDAGVVEENDGPTPEAKRAPAAPESADDSHADDSHADHADHDSHADPADQGDPRSDATASRPAAEAAAARAQDEAAAAQARATAARQAADAAKARSDAPAPAPAAPATVKADRAEATPARPAAAPAARAADDEEIGGTLGLQVIVSQVTCKGAKPAALVVEEDKPKPPAEPPDQEKSHLPKTGGDSHAASTLGATGLGLLIAGSAAVYATRRRGRHAR